jgi:hypothetical protein
MVTSGDNWDKSWNFSVEGVQKSADLISNINWNEAFGKAATDFKKGFSMYLVGTIGEDKYNTLNDGKWTAEDAGIIFMAYISFRASRGIGTKYDGFKDFNRHYDTHVLGKNGRNREFGDDFTKDDYYNAAYKLATTQADGNSIFTKTLSGGRVATYNRSTNELVIVHGGTEIGTFFKPKYGSTNPNAGYNYYLNLK